MPKHVMVM